MSYNQQANTIPNGWLDCPAFGNAIQCIIPMKTPLDSKFEVPFDRQHSPESILNFCLQQKYQVGLVIDLTNSNRYYDPQEFMKRGVEHVKIRCKGKKTVPDPDAVNVFVYEVIKFMKYIEAYQKEIYQNQEKMEMPRCQMVLLVHCTHGFNRTGYMISQYVTRTRESVSPKYALQMFAHKRPPGIYKDDYINKLFEYFHEKRSPDIVTPPTPAWKGAVSPPESPRDEQQEEEGSVPSELHHEDTIGENIPDEEKYLIKQQLASYFGQNIEHEGQLRFPGGQPISLSRQNIDKLSPEKYSVTWKADGTRYLLYILKHGVFLIDRKYEIKRFQMTFPTSNLMRHLNDWQVYRANKLQRERVHVHQNHVGTLIDGEMVVDKDPNSGQLFRRFLAYDTIALNGVSMIGHPFNIRWNIIQDEVITPRMKHKEMIMKGRMPFYDYDKEFFKVRRKEFYPLNQSRILLETFIPQLCHEADGLIFQSSDAAYKSGTDSNILKWKFPSLNSVDFHLSYKNSNYNAIRSPADTINNLELLVIGNQGRYVPVKDAKITFPEGVDCKQYIQKIVECTYDRVNDQWVFLRERKDKQTPNAYTVYEKVFESILDDITDNELLKYVESSFAGSPELQNTQNGHTAAGAPTKPDVPSSQQTQNELNDKDPQKLSNLYAFDSQQLPNKRQISAEMQDLKKSKSSTSQDLNGMSIDPSQNLSQEATQQNNI